MTDLNMTLLAEWVVRQFGKALLLSMAVAFAGAFIAALVGDPSWLFLAYLGGPVAFGVSLAVAKAPSPVTEEDVRAVESQTVKRSAP